MLAAVAKITPMFVVFMKRVIIIIAQKNDTVMVWRIRQRSEMYPVMPPSDSNTSHKESTNLLRRRLAAWHICTKAMIPRVKRTRRRNVVKRVAMLKRVHQHHQLEMESESVVTQGNESNQTGSSTSHFILLKEGPKTWYLIFPGEGAKGLKASITLIVFELVNLSE